MNALRLADGRVLDLYLAGPQRGIPFVFHCGTPGAGIPFDRLVRVLAERGLRYVSWSRPGYGSSTRKPGRAVADVVADQTAVMNELGADACYVLGWSGGGPHALASAALSDRVVAAATIAGAAPYPADGLDWMAGMGPENVEEFGAAIAGSAELEAFMGDAWPTYRHVTGEAVAGALGQLIDEVDRASLTGDFAEWVAAAMREGLRESYRGWFDDDLAFTRPWGFDPASIRVPVHIWQGAHDRMVPYAHGEWLAANVGGACPHLLPEHGHLSLAVDSLPRIVDELIGSRARS
jgi:pimeloyl-ACP methyl ester carboxylesterase